MPPHKPSPELAFEIHFAANLASTDILDRLQRTLLSNSPAFCEELSVLSYEHDRMAAAVDVSKQHSLRDAVLAKGADRGPTFERLAAMGPPTNPRQFGSVLLRGDARDTYVTVSFDAHAPLHRAGEQFLFSNSITASSSAPRIAGSEGVDWIRRIVACLAEHADVLWGAAYDVREFRERNLHQGDDGTGAMGRDPRRSLPGLFWLNVFGPRYRRLIGDGRLLQSAALNIECTGSAILLSTYERPEEWATAEGRLRHREVLEAIGQKYFFNREDPAAETVAPPFTLPEPSV
jgi:hypothetical protein